MRSLILIIFFVSLASSAWAGGDLQEFCVKLNKKLLFAKHADEAYDIAIRDLNFLKNTIHESRRQLKDAWEAVYRLDSRQSCSKISPFRILETIIDCGARRLTGMKNSLWSKGLGYLKWCLTDEDLKQLLWGAVRELTDVRTTMNEYLSFEFIQAYREAHPEEVQLKHALREGATCCSPLLAAPLMVKTAADIQAQRIEPNKEVMEHLEANPGEVESLISEAMAEPCKRYVDAVEPVMNRTRSLMKMKEEEVVDKLAGKFEVAIFRYKFCLALISKK